jgi:V-type H+-transporting ATPase subunit H
MIAQDDYNVISAYSDADGEKRAAIFNNAEHSLQVTRTWMNLINNVSKVQTVRYVLTMIDDSIYVSVGGRVDDALTCVQEDNKRVRIFWAYARATRQSVWAPLLLMLTRDDGFVVNQASRLLCKLACWGEQTIKSNEQAQYFAFLKEQLRQPVG